MNKLNFFEQTHTLNKVASEHLNLIGDNDWLEFILED